MSFDLPASLEHDLELYAQAEHISTAEAVVKLVQDALRSKKRKVTPKTLTAEQQEQLRNSPTAAFFGGLSDDVLDQMEMASKQIHAERFTPRG